MAHQAHNIPWTLVADNLVWRLSNTCLDGANNFHLRFRPGMGKQLSYFATAFARNIHGHADCQRRKYPERYEPPEPDDLVVSDAVAARIAQTINRWQMDKEWLWPSGGRTWHEECVHNNGDPYVPSDNEPCSCPLPDERRRMKAFLDRLTHCHSQDFLDFNYLAFFNVEVIKTLIMYGEMDTALRICAHPDIELAWWHRPQAVVDSNVLGWEWIYRFALDAYVTLNVVHCFPEMWGTSHSQSPQVNDYRCTRAYQYMLHRTTCLGRTSDVPMYPHRQFFGINNTFISDFPWVSTRGMWSPEYRTQRGPTNPLWGRVSFEHFLEQGRYPTCGRGQPSWYLPSVGDVSLVRWLLRKKLPVELVDMVLDEALYVPRRRLPVAHDPFHPDNRDELARYLAYCWQLIVRCELAGRALGVSIRWETVVAETLGELFNCRCGSTREPRLFGSYHDDHSSDAGGESIRFNYG